MNIYVKLPKDIQYNIVNHIRKTHFESVLLNDIKRARRKFIVNCIDKISPSFKKYSRRNNALYEWFNLSSREEWIWRPLLPTTKYIRFLKEIFPNIIVTNNLFDVYCHYKENYIGDYYHFIQLLLNNLSIEDLEHLYNYIRFIDFGFEKINKSPLLIESVFPVNIF